jgi:hypothetical protein
MRGVVARPLRCVVVVLVLVGLLVVFAFLFCGGLWL